MSYSLSEAKDKLSEVVEKAITDGPQEIICANQEPVVIVRKQLFDRIAPNAVDSFFGRAQKLDEDFLKIMGELEREEP